MHSIRRQHPCETIYAAIFHNFYCDNTYLYFPSLSVGTEELLARVVEKYQSEYGFAESRARLEQSLRWSGADLAEYLFDGDAAGNAAAQSVQAAVRQEADWDDLYDRFRQCFRAPAAAPPKICCAPSSSPPILSPLPAMKTKS